MTTNLTKVAYSQELRVEVEAFFCGDTVHEVELAVWIKEEALQAIEDGTKVWLYYNEKSELVGYGSLGESQWRYPDPRASKKTPVLVIPAVAIQKTFQGTPEGDRDQRYSSLIMRDIIAEAQRWPGNHPALGLFVHPDNQGAIRLYARFDFKRFERDYKDRTTGQIYHGYIREPI